MPDAQESTQDNKQDAAISHSLRCNKTGILIGKFAMKIYSPPFFITNEMVSLYCNFAQVSGENQANLAAAHLALVYMEG